MSSQQPFNHGGVGGAALPVAAPANVGVAGLAANRPVYIPPLHPNEAVSPPGSTTGSLHNPRTSNDRNLGLGEVEHIHFLSEHIGALFLNDEYSDVTLIVQGQRFDAHRVILAARSEYFRALLFGGMRESRLNEIELQDTPLAAFKFLLRYIYTGQINLGKLKDDLIVDILGLAHQYGFQDLEGAISDYLKAILNIRNVCFIYDTASLYQLDHLKNSCSLYMDRHAAEIIKHESFTTLSATGFRDIISRDSFCAPEVDIFRAVVEWVRVNNISRPSPATSHVSIASALSADAEDEDKVDKEPSDASKKDTGDTLANILSAVRLSLMSTPDLLRVVRPTQLVPPDVMLDAIQSRTESRDMELKYRGYLIPEENVAQPRHGAQVLIGEVKHALLDGDTKNYNMEQGFSRHPIDESADSKGGIIVKLGMQCIVNHVRMLLWDKDSRAYSYFIEVSMDQQDWIRVVDHSRFHCRSWQDLYFEPRVVRFLRIVGTHNTVNKVFHVVSFEAYYIKKEFNLDPAGILIPTHNVATIAKSACVIEGVCRSRNALLNGEVSNYDWDSGYTCHQLGSGAIVVQLGQPYSLGSMRLLLWDCDDRSYSYYVEVSVNQREWEVVCDRSRENCKSWQTIQFPPRPVVYIKIVGTHNTANEVFHCVHFECPAICPSTGEAIMSSASGLTVNMPSSMKSSPRKQLAATPPPPPANSNAVVPGSPQASSELDTTSTGSSSSSSSDSNNVAEAVGAVGGASALHGRASLDERRRSGGGVAQQWPPGYEQAAAAELHGHPCLPGQVMGRGGGRAAARNSGRRHEADDFDYFVLDQSAALGERPQGLRVGEVVGGARSRNGGGSGSRGGASSSYVTQERRRSDQSSGSPPKNERDRD